MFANFDYCLVLCLHRAKVVV